eukprot:363344-Chlamydomonas_euryale.AAC.2
MLLHAHFPDATGITLPSRNRYHSSQTQQASHFHGSPPPPAIRRSAPHLTALHTIPPSQYVEPAVAAPLRLLRLPASHLQAPPPSPPVHRACSGCFVAVAQAAQLAAAAAAAAALLRPDHNVDHHQWPEQRVGVELRAALLCRHTVREATRIEELCQGRVVSGEKVSGGMAAFEDASNTHAFEDASNTHAFEDASSTHACAIHSCGCRGGSFWGGRPRGFLSRIKCEGVKEVRQEREGKARKEETKEHEQATGAGVAGRATEMRQEGVREGGQAE